MVMTRVKLTEEQEDKFNRNFDREAYSTAKAKVQKIISEANSYGKLWTGLCMYEKDVEFTDDGTIIFCEVELDRSHMETSCDYVGVTFDILIGEDDKGSIIGASLYTSDTNDGEVELLCFINHNTCEVTEWDSD